MRARHWAAVTIGILTVLAVVFFAGGGHPARLQAVEPADGGVYAAPVPQVALRFDAAPALKELHLEVYGPSGASVGRGDASVVGDRIVLQIDGTRAGRYRIGYHVRQSGAADVSGLSEFTVGGGGPAAVPDPAEPAAPGHSHLGRDPSTVLLLAIDAVAFVVLGAVLIRRPRAR